MKSNRSNEMQINRIMNRPTRQSLSEQKQDFYIVGIGASAGGLEALEQFFSNMPSECVMAFVVIQHLSPDYKSFMPELLSKRTKLKVYQIQDGMKIEPGCVYLNPPRYNVMMSNGRFVLKAHESAQKVNLAVDTFLESLAANQKEKSVGVILSGTGSDGTRGCRSIKECGGLVLVQDDKTAKFNGMPKSVISTKAYDYILAPGEMADVITNQVSLISEKELSEEKAVEAKDTLSQIFDIIKKKYSIDFGLYKQSTVLRCLDRRMRICQQPSFDEYLLYLNDSTEEIDHLYNSLLIGVTKFFRDQEAFETIRNQVIPEILKNKESGAPVRIWVAGCSTGEEAYSLAILFREYMDSIQKNYNVKIFATDIDANAIEYASVGAYPDSIAEDVSLERLNRFFIKRRDVYQVTKAVREMVIFSLHNLINNPPFYKIDLISCRNLLIYFKPKLQTRIISSFQFALESSGFLFLGTSETTGEMSSYFSSFDAKWKIFRRKDTAKRPLVDDFSVVSTGVKVMTSNHPDDYLWRVTKNNWEMEDIYLHLIEQCLPSCVVVDEFGELVQVCGDADRFLRVPKGRATNEIQKMVPKELTTAIGTAVNKVRKEKNTVIYTNIRTGAADGQLTINLVVRPLFTRKNGMLILIEFQEIKSEQNVEEWVENFDTVAKLQERINDLEQELQYTKESLQTSIEEIETSSEELQSANEELLVSNEELHSTNEELQSVNEELIVVNTQYQYKIQELADLNNDMTNFINSTTIGTIFLDTNLCVRKFTPAVTREINLLEQDINRPINHISHNLIGEDIIKTSEEVMESLIPVEREVKSSHGRWYIVKYSPYRTSENIIKGVVISLVDITLRKEAEDSLMSSMLRYEKLIAFSPYAIFLIKDNLIQLTNHEGAKIFRARDPKQMTGKPIYNYIEIASIKAEIEAARQDDNEKAIPVERRITCEDGSDVIVELMSMSVTFEDGDYDLIMLHDVTNRKQNEKLRAENMESRRLLEEAIAFEGFKNEFFSNLSHELRTPLNVIMSTLQLIDGQVESIVRTEKVGKMKKHMKIMKQNCFRQLRLVNNMIDITKIDSGFYDLKSQNLDIVQIVESITMSVSDYVRSKSINLSFDSDTPEKIIAFDPDAIERIMLNLLSNAVKFSKEGGTIAVSMQCTDKEVTVKVRDSGIGIPEDKTGLIFDRFRQVDKSLARNHEGSGIGLSLVKSLVGMHGGGISVESEYGQGSAFIFTLPAVTTPDEIAVHEEKKSKPNIEKIHLEFSDIYSVH